MKGNLVLVFLLIQLLSCWAFAHGPGCNVQAQNLNCGGALVSDGGCTVTPNQTNCPTSSDPICYPAECHSITAEFDYLCKNNPQLCVTGISDGLIYVVNHSSCFCD